jgi:glyoxylase-like metal-dependent hydrolase (beta-lactamase superfamily II)
LSVHIIDTLQLERPGIIAVTVLETNDGVAIFDTGPESTFANVSAGLKRCGVELADVRHVFLSHIHFDHAGAAFRFAETGATIYVHGRGAPHLIDPAKLIESATRIFGDDMDRLWGRIAPVPPNNVRVLRDNDSVRVGEFHIRAIETPGHASHHHVYHWNDTLFGGDVAGVRLGNGPAIPPFVPPELHVEAWLQSIARMKELNAEVLYLPHFGRIDTGLENHFDQLHERVERWSGWLRQGIAGNQTDSQLVAEFSRYEHQDLEEGGATEAEVADYEAADPSYMAVPAALRYWKKFHGIARSGDSPGG